MKKSVEEQLLGLLKDIKARKVDITPDEATSADAIEMKSGMLHFDISTWRI